MINDLFGHYCKFQVQHLLKEVEELKGGRVVRDDLNVSSSSDVTSSASIISEKLVTFRWVNFKITRFKIDNLFQVVIYITANLCICIKV